MSAPLNLTATPLTVSSGTTVMNVSPQGVILSGNISGGNATFANMYITTMLTAPAFTASNVQAANATVTSNISANNVNISNLLTVLGNTSVGGTLNVTGATTASNLTVSNLIVTTSINVPTEVISNSLTVGTLTVSNTGTFANTLTSVGAFTAANTATINGALTAGSTLVASGAISGQGGAIVSCGNGINATVGRGAILPGISLSDGNKGIFYSGGAGSGGQFFNGSPAEGPIVHGYADGALGTNYNSNGQANPNIALYWNRLNQVGINSTSPQYNLDVNGTARVTGALTSNGTAYIAGSLTVAANASNIGSVLLGTYPTLTNSMVVMNQQQASNIATNYALYQGTGGDTILNSSAGQPLTFRNAGNEKVRIDPQGNVGIGTIAPLYPLDVNGPSNHRGPVFFNQQVVNQVLSLYNSIDNANSASTSFYGLGVNSNVMRYQVPTGSSHTWYAGTTSVMSASVSALSGAATLSTSAVYTTQLYNNGFISPGNTISYGGLYLGWNRNGGYGIAGFYNQVGGATIGTGYSGGFEWGVYNNNGTVYSNVAMLSPAGNLYVSNSVGIGTAGPAYNLDVQGTLRTTGAANTGPLSVNGQLTTTGNVGIGTTSPAFILDVSGNVRISTMAVSGVSAMYLSNRNFSSNASNGYWAVYQGTSGDTCLNTAAGQPLRITGNGVDTMRIDPQGNVGIGTVTPAYNLDVQGTLRTTGAANVGPLSVIGTVTSNALVVSNTISTTTAAASTSIVAPVLGAGYTSPASVSGTWALDLNGYGLIRNTLFFNNQVQNQMISLYNGGSYGTAGGTDFSVQGSTSFYGIGVNANCTRYQVPAGASYGHYFYSGSTLVANISAAGVTTAGGISGQGLQITNATSPLVFAGPGSSGANLCLDWSTYTPPVGGTVLPALRWQMIDSGSTTASLNLLQTVAGSVGALNTSRLFLSSGGLLGLGTTSPAYTLDVAGNVRVTSNLVNTGRIVGNNTSSTLYTAQGGSSSSNATSIVLPLSGDQTTCYAKFAMLGNTAGTYSTFNLRMAVSVGNATTFDTTAADYAVALMAMSGNTSATIAPVAQATTYPTLATSCRGNLTTHTVQITYSSQITDFGSGTTSGSMFDVAVNGYQDQSASNNGFPAYKNYGTVAHNPGGDLPATYIRLTVENQTNGLGAAVRSAYQPMSFF